jgi:outer membrane protein assembly factor BamB
MQTFQLSIALLLAGSATASSIRGLVHKQGPTLRWTFPVSSNDGASTPTRSGDGATLFVGSGGNIYALKTADGSLLWNYTLSDDDSLNGGPYKPTLSPDGATVFIGASDGVHALKTADGSLLWTYATEGCGHISMDFMACVSPTPSADGTTLFVGAADNNVYALKTADGSLLWKYNTGAEVTSSPILSADGSTLFVGSHGDDGIHTDNMYALDTTDGSLLWKDALCDAECDGVNSAPTLSADGATLFVSSDDWFVSALNTIDGSRRWRFGKAALESTSPTLSSDGAALFIGLGSGACNHPPPPYSPARCQNTVQALYTTDGSLLWQYSTSDFVHTSPTLSADGTKLFVGSVDNTLSALHTADGSLAWKYATDGGYLSSPTCSADGATLFVGSNQVIWALARP